MSVFNPVVCLNKKANQKETRPSITMSYFPLQSNFDLNVQQQQQQQQQQAQEKAAKRRRNGMIAGVLLLLLLVAGAIIALVFLLPKKEETNTGGGGGGGGGGENDGAKDWQVKDVEQFCKDPDFACEECEPGYGPNESEYLKRYIEMSDAGVPIDVIEASIPPLCSGRPTPLFAQTRKAYYAPNLGNLSTTGNGACHTEFGASTSVTAGVVSFRENRETGETTGGFRTEDFKSKAGLENDKTLTFEDFEKLMEEREADATLEPGMRYFTCRFEGYAVPEPTACAGQGGENLRFPECEQCKPGYGPEPPADNACQEKYEKTHEYRLLSQCLSEQWLRDSARRTGTADWRAAGCPDGDFVEFVPQGHAAAGGALDAKYMSYQALYDAIYSDSDTGDLNRINVTPCPAVDPSMRGVICRRTTWVPKDKLETAEQVAFRESKPLETKQAEQSAEEKRLKDAFTGQQGEDYANSLRTTLEARVTIDGDTGDVRLGYFGNLIPNYTQQYGELPLLPEQAKEAFAALSGTAKQKVALAFVGPQGSLNSEQAASVCAVRKQLADFREEVNAYLTRTFNEFASWPPKTAQPINSWQYNPQTGNNEPTFVCN